MIVVEYHRDPPVSHVHASEVVVQR